MSPSAIPTTFAAGDGLLLVDPQNDFCPGGSLPVVGGDRVMPILSDWAAAAQRAGVPIFVSRDWHPQRTTHFKEFGGVWPPHCVRGTHGAEFHPGFRLPSNVTVVSKGTGETEDAYSAFQARDDNGTELAALLEQSGVHHLYLGGLATDYCVKFSTLDALGKGYTVTLIPDAVRAVNVQVGDGEKALAEMRAAGAEA
jgi:nicotinamidase/pyrazinamidase